MNAVSFRWYGVYRILTSKIIFPIQLEKLLEGSDLHAHIRAFADQVAIILADNQMPFFPDYTDHGLDHINHLLESEEELIPTDVWENSQNNSRPRSLCAVDSVVIIGATLLHDIAMHLRESGFLALISENSIFHPLPWFNESHENHQADRPWHELWEEYSREVRRFSDTELGAIIGEEEALGWRFDELLENTGDWRKKHRLIIGEFIRRHHARLAHEIAIYGFPGLIAGSGTGEFPALGNDDHLLNDLADLIGLVARSHGTNLRLCQSYLCEHYGDIPQHMGTSVLYPMALLRVADYLQIDHKRAPAVLLQLRNPQSPVSVQEWQKHKAIRNIGPAKGPRGKMITVNENISLPLFLQLQELIAGLQAEIDHSTAVLDESYGNNEKLGLHRLNLSTRRIYSNMNSKAFLDKLPYVPFKAGFSSDPHLLSLLVEPLYGRKPGVAIRELTQNAADAVRELKTWCDTRKIQIDSLDLPVHDGDVLIEFIRKEDGSWMLRVSDKGIGMTSDTIQNYFLRAGASFRQSPEWYKEFLDEKGKANVTRAGRFGIGTFAIFLLGQAFRIRTRHASNDKSNGYLIEASVNSQLIEIQRIESHCIGTTIEIDISKDAVSELASKGNGYYIPPFIIGEIDWFCWDWPQINFCFVRGENVEQLDQQYKAQICNGKQSPDWSVIYPKDYNAVFWTYGEMPAISCNGIKITTNSDNAFDWPENTGLYPPCIAVVDNAANLPLTIRRDKLTHNRLPFIGDLVKDVVTDFIAYNLVCGPESQADALTYENKYPLCVLKKLFYRNNNIGSPIQYICATATEMVPADPWLYTLLSSESYISCGVIYKHRESQGHEIFHYFGLSDIFSSESLIIKELSNSHVILPWFCKVGYEDVLQTIENFAKGSLLGIDLDTLNVHATIVTDDATIIKQLTSSSLTSFNKINWKKSEIENDFKEYFEFHTDDTVLSLIPIDILLHEIESSIRKNISIEESNNIKSRTMTILVSDIRTKDIKRPPKSVIAKIWEECLGAHAIPFDPEAREVLIAEGCKHPALKRHIESWKEMKRTGSKWIR